MTSNGIESTDILSSSISISAKLEENSLSVATKSRAFAGFDRLLGSLMDCPAAFFEGLSAKKRLKDEIHRKMLVAQGATAERIMIGSSATADGLLLDFINKESRRRQNAGSVAIEALDALKTTPLIENQKEPQPAEDVTKLDEDWLNMFGRYAEDASSDDLQQIWGQVLAREIRRPGSFSKQTIRFIAELDKETAENCQIAVDHIVRHFIPLTEFWTQGEGVGIGIDLQRLGLIEGLGAFGLGRTFQIGDDGNLFISGEEFGLHIIGTPLTILKCQSIQLTRLGLQVFSLLKPNDERVGLKEAANLIAKDSLTRIEIGKYKHLSEGLIDFYEEDLLWEKDS